MRQMKVLSPLLFLVEFRDEVSLPPGMRRLDSDPLSVPGVATCHAATRGQW